MTDLAALDRAAASVRDAFPDPWLRQYSVKANDVPAIVAEVAARGFGANAVSRGEWAVARRAGVADGRITLEGVGKTDADLRAAVRAAATGSPLLWVALESADEAEVVTRMARRAGLGRGDRPALDVLVRLNPDVTPETIAGLAVGDGASKFGMTETEATGARRVDHVARRRAPSGRAGSTCTSDPSCARSMPGGMPSGVVSPSSGCSAAGSPAFDTLDVGGGFPILPLDESGPAPERFARELPALLDAVPADRRPSRLAIEPGRALVARAGWLVARVLHVRDRGGRQVVIDAGMTELIRPALYGARHPIVALTSEGRAIDADDDLALEPTRVEGPICESTDALGTHDLPPLRRGDLVAIADAGAYAASLSSTYNGRPRAPQVFIETDGNAPARPAGAIVTSASR